jgi:rusticyanin
MAARARLADVKAGEPNRPGPGLGASGKRRQEDLVNRARLAAVAAAAAVAAGGAGTAVAFAAGGSPTPSSPAAAAASPGTGSGSGYAYYRSVMGGLDGGASMMGGSYGWMMGGRGYAWMMGGTSSAPAWMRGSALPGIMMGTSHDPGQVMGALWADAPGPRVSPARAARLGNQVPAGASVDRAANRVSFSGTSARLVVLASPSMPAESFRIAGLTNPAIAVPAGAHVSIEVINADTGMAHGLVITAAGEAASWMPMMTDVPAFTGSALWFLGNPTPAGMHAATLSFTAAASGHYTYLCPVPGHAQKGMAGAFTVTGTP